MMCMMNKMMIQKMLCMSLDLVCHLVMRLQLFLFNNFLNVFSNKKTRKNLVSMSLVFWYELEVIPDFAQEHF